MRQKTLWLVRTALMLALLIALQALTRPLGQLVTGSCVNALLALTALLSGHGSGAVVALLSPVFAFVLGIAPQILTVPAIMAGNLVYVLLLALPVRALWQRALVWLAAAAAKFALLYGAVAGLLCSLFADALLAQGLLKAPMLTALPATFSWPQLLTALIGGGVALLLAPVLQKTVHPR